MEQRLDDAADALASVLTVSGWPRWARRLFIATLPISGPAWVALVFSLLVTGIILLLGSLALKSVGGSASGAWRAICQNWNRP